MAELDRIDQLEQRIDQLTALVASLLAESNLAADALSGEEGPEPVEDEGVAEAGLGMAATRGGPTAQEFAAYFDGFAFPNFSGSEITPYFSRTRGGVSNSVPPKHLWPNFIQTMVVLQHLRQVLGRPITLTSTYRSPDYNRAVGGASQSEHVKFRAIDFQVSGLLPAQVAQVLRSLRGKVFLNPATNKSFTFRGGIGVYATFVHVDTRPNESNWVG